MFKGLADTQQYYYSLSRLHNCTLSPTLKVFNYITMYSRASDKLNQPIRPSLYFFLVVLGLNGFITHLNLIFIMTNPQFVILFRSMNTNKPTRTTRPYRQYPQEPKSYQNRRCVTVSDRCFEWIQFRLCFIESAGHRQPVSGLCPQISPGETEVCSYSLVHLINDIAFQRYKPELASDLV